jgi:carbon storage regulator
MLVLSRKENESIMIGDDIKITMVRFAGDKVKIGILAPQHMPVHREEVYQAIKRSGGDVTPGNPHA